MAAWNIYLVKDIFFVCVCAFNWLNQLELVNTGINDASNMREAPQM